MRKMIHDEISGYQLARPPSWHSLSHIGRQHAEVAARLVDETPQARVDPPQTLRRDILRSLQETKPSAGPRIGLDPCVNRGRAATLMLFACMLLLVVTAGMFVQQRRYNATDTAMHATSARESPSVTAKWLQQLFDDAGGSDENRFETPLMYEMRALMHDANEARDFVLNNVPFAARLAHSKKRNLDAQESSLNTTVQ